MHGSVTEVLPDGRYRVTLENGHNLIAYAAASSEEPHPHHRRRRGHPRDVPYDLTKGRITFRPRLPANESGTGMRGPQSRRPPPLLNRAQPEMLARPQDHPEPVAPGQTMRPLPGRRHRQHLGNHLRSCCPRRPHPTPEHASAVSADPGGLRQLGLVSRLRSDAAPAGGQFSASTAEVALIITGFTVAYGAMQLDLRPWASASSASASSPGPPALCAVGLGRAGAQPRMLTACRILTGGGGRHHPDVDGGGFRSGAGRAAPGNPRPPFLGQILGMVFGQVLGGVCVDFGPGDWPSGYSTGLYLLIAFASLAKDPPGGDAPRRTGGRRHGQLPEGPDVPRPRDPRRWPAFSWKRCWSSACSPALYLHQRFGLALSRRRLPLMLYGAGVCCSPRWRRAWAADEPPGVSDGGGRAGGAGRIRAPLAGHPAGSSPRLLSASATTSCTAPCCSQITQRAPNAQPGPGLSVSLFFGQSVGASAAGWLVDQGRITLVFAIAALGMPLLGLAAGRQIRPA